MTVPEPTDRVRVEEIAGRLGWSSSKDVRRTKFRRDSHEVWMYWATDESATGARLIWQGVEIAGEGFGGYPLGAGLSWLQAPGRHTPQDTMRDTMRDRLLAYATQLEGSATWMLVGPHSVAARLREIAGGEQ